MDYTSFYFITKKWGEKKIGRWYIGSTKTEGSKREVYICDTLYSILVNYKEQQDRNKKEFGKKYKYYSLKEIKNKYGKVVEYVIIESKSKKDRADMVFTKRNGLYSGTDDATESIPMWNMYTQDMQGVKIRLKKFPFKKYNFKCGQYHFKSDAETYIDYEKLYIEDKTTIAGEPQLVKVIYTNDENLIYPTVKSIKEEIKKLDDGRMQRSTSKKYSLSEIGKYKRKNWEFQNEVRYIINMSLWSMKELENCKSAEEQSMLIDRIEDSKYKAPYNLFFLNLDDEALDNLEILIGPKVTEAQETIIRLIVEKYCPNAKILKSSLKIS